MKKTKSNKHKATIILIAVTAGFLISSVFYDTFTGGLFTALFGASMVGGLADWFGITALFRKPLGISYKTEIIPRNRERLYDSLIYMVENELLSKEGLKNKIEKIDFSQKLLTYLYRQGGKEEVSNLVIGIATDMLDSLEPEKAGLYLKSLIEKNTENIDLVKLFGTSSDWLVSNSLDDRIMPVLVEKAKVLIMSPAFVQFANEVVQDVFSNLRQSTEKETAGKKLFFRLLFTMADISDASPHRISTRLLNEAVEYLNSLLEKESTQRKGINAFIARNVNELKSDKDLQQKARAKGLDLLKGTSLGNLFTKYLFPYLRSNSQLENFREFVGILADRLLEGFKNNINEQEALDRFVKNIFIQLVDENHHQIGKMVREKLEMFSSEMLVEMIEEKAGNDLQIIRINGSLVGGLVGLVIYLLTFYI